MLFDRVTQLVWSAAPLGPIEWSQTPAACAALHLGGFSDWRVPTRIEFLSVVNYDFIPATSADFEMPRAEYWTASPFASDVTRAWYVALNAGGAVDRPQSDAMHVSCVRAGRVAASAPSFRFVTGVGTVFDKQTNLTWEANSGPGSTFAQASARCKALVLGGAGGFRLPTIHELHSIVDERRAGPALDPSSGAGSLRWSSTPRSGASDSVWTVDEYDGHTLIYSMTSTASPRCVK